MKDRAKKLFKKLCILLLYMIPPAVLYIISVSFFSEIYLFKWAIKENFLAYMWIIIMIFALRGKHYIAVCLEVGNVVGLFAGQYLGDYIREKNMLLISEDTPGDIRYNLSYHRGHEIWIYVFLASLVVGVIITYIKKRRI